MAARRRILSVALILLSASNGLVSSEMPEGRLVTVSEIGPTMKGLHMNPVFNIAPGRDMQSATQHLLFGPQRPPNTVPPDFGHPPQQELPSFPHGPVPGPIPRPIPREPIGVPPHPGGKQDIISAAHNILYGQRPLNHPASPSNFQEYPIGAEHNYPPLGPVPRDISSALPEAFYTEHYGHFQPPLHQPPIHPPLIETPAIHIEYGHYQPPLQPPPIHLPLIETSPIHIHHIETPPVPTQHIQTPVIQTHIETHPVPEIALPPPAAPIPVTTPSIIAVEPPTPTPQPELLIPSQPTPTIIETAPVTIPLDISYLYEYLPCYAQQSPISFTINAPVCEEPVVVTPPVCTQPYYTSVQPAPMPQHTPVQPQPIVILERSRSKWRNLLPIFLVAMRDGGCQNGRNCCSGSSVPVPFPIPVPFSVPSPPSPSKKKSDSDSNC